ncbi:hypothetical protein CDL15_Pgr012368 [Punica granatum]|uniref:Uncharacterized protein n=1 Tax=Punica granatum TaxID=22663 RepID=A0A218WLY5_PUNGR|nr:hypothetical protein CDL15_Pgr012368 [Punica granatum]
MHGGPRLLKNPKAWLEVALELLVPAQTHTRREPKGKKMKPRKMVTSREWLCTMKGLLARDFLVTRKRKGRGWPIKGCRHDSP